jgi:hypothetical protein
LFLKIMLIMDFDDFLIPQIFSLFFSTFPQTPVAHWLKITALDGSELSASYPCSPYPLDRRLSGPQSHLGQCGKQEYLLPCQESNPNFSAIQPTACSYMN